MFPVQHSSTKKDGDQIVNDTKLLTMQNSDGSCIGPGLLYSYRQMPSCLLTNLCIQLNIVNRARTIVYEVILNPEDNCKLFQFRICY